MTPVRHVTVSLLVLFTACAALAQGPNIAAVTNGASFDRTLSPGTQTSIFGNNLSAGTCPNKTLPAPTTLCNTMVLVNGVATPLFYVSPQQINFQLPFELRPGAASVIVNAEGTRSSPFAIQLAAYSPGLLTLSSAGSGVGTFVRQNGSLVLPQNAVNPGEIISAFAFGLGPTDPPTPTNSAPAAGMLVKTVASVTVTMAGRRVAPLFAGLAASSNGIFPIVYQIVFAVPGDLTPGSYPLFLEIGGFTSNTVTIPIAITGLLLTQTGLTFQAVQGGGNPSSKSFRILNGTTGVLNFTITTSTISGGSGWLSVSPATGSSDPARGPFTIDVQVNPAGLSPGDYYGQVRVDAPGAPNTPQFLSAVLNVSGPAVNPGPVVEPTGLVFVAAVGGSNPAAQSVKITNLTNRSSAFRITPSFSGGPTWFMVSPTSGTVSPNQPVAITVQPNIAGLATNVYRGALAIDFPQDTTTRTIDLLLVVAPRPPVTLSESALSSDPDQAACTPGKLLPVFTLLGANFNTSAAWPAPIEVSVVDDCGNALRTGTVTTTFSNGDPPLGLVPQADGRWSGTWAPRNARTPNTTVTATAQQADLKLTGTAQVTGSLQANPEVPTISSGGVVSAASFAKLPSPGEIVSVFGIKLADGIEVSSALPLPPLLKGARLTIAGKPLPIIFTSENQVNAVLPYGIATGTTVQLVAQRGNRISVPEPVTIAPAQPAIFTTNSTGAGQGHIYVLPSATEQILADAARPAKAGDLIVLYCEGLGAVTPAVDAGAATPSDAVRKTSAAVGLTIGGQTASVIFAGLTPGFAGLYQINATVPTGVTPGDSVPVVLTESNAQSAPVTMAVR